MQMERDRILELRDLGLSLWQITTRLGQDVSAVQRCVAVVGRTRTKWTDHLIGRMVCSVQFCTAKEIGRHTPNLGRQIVSAQTIRRRLLGAWATRCSIDRTPPLSKAIVVHSKTAMETGMEVYPLQQ